MVDDEEHITELVAMGLGYNGFDVERAATGRAALAAVEQRKPDLIVLDVMLPDLDGFEVARRLREAEGAGTRVPVIFLTARDATQDKIQGLRLGSDDYVTKPFSIEELVERVKAVLRRASGAGPGEHRLSYADPRASDEGHPRGLAGRAADRAHAHGVQAPLLPALERPPRAHPGPDPRARVGLHLRRQRQHVLRRDLHQLRLRHKIDDVDPPLIHTVRRVGYSLRLPPDRGRLSSAGPRGPPQHRLGLPPASAR